MRRRSVFLAKLEVSLRDRPQDSVSDELRRVILDGDSPPGALIPLAEVAELLGVSQIPVREALKTLVGEGLVAHRPNAGYVVAQLSRQELAELYVVRGVLEAAALRTALARPPSTTYVAEATAALAALHEALVQEDHRAYHRESRRFHLALMAPSRLLRLQRMVESAWNLTEPVQPMRYLDSTQRWELHRDHESMLEAFAAGDVTRMLALTAEHQDHLEACVRLVPDEAGLAPETAAEDI